MDRSLDSLVLIPTYNERENLQLLYRRLKELGIPLDILIVDDHSPDGTGEIAEQLSSEDSSLHVIHRTGKLGVGSAHQEGIRWAYKQGYRTLITMDCDFTHKPEDIPLFLNIAREADVVVGSRYINSNSLEDWNLFRKALTHLGHFLTVHLLKIPQDASGAFRVYRLDRVPQALFSKVSSTGYSFFFESLHLMALNGFVIKEVPILLPARTYGHSKMRLKDAFASLGLLFKIYLNARLHRDQFLIKRTQTQRDAAADERNWDQYWNQQEAGVKKAYSGIAALYRKILIRPALNFFIRSEFSTQAKILHAGCGGGQVDEDISQSMQVTALDISNEALRRYKALHGEKCQIIHGSIFQIPAENGSFDGIYNLGVMEHFDEWEIQNILLEFKRVLKQNGKIVLFWPPTFGLTVGVLDSAHFILNSVLRRHVKLHPDEISRIRSHKHAKELIERSGLRLKKFYFGPLDLFTHAILVVTK